MNARILNRFVVDVCWKMFHRSYCTNENMWIALLSPPALAPFPDRSPSGKMHFEIRRRDSFP